MKERTFAALLGCLLFLAVGGDAQNKDAVDKPVWTLEFIRVTGSGAMAYLDDNWMRVRAEAKKEGAVLDYHRMQNAVLELDGNKTGDRHSFVLMTEFKNMGAFLKSEKLFASIR